MIELSTHESIRDVGEEAWRGLLADDAPPYLAFEFLDALERTGCVRPERGWMPMHFTLRLDGEVVGAAPAYVKGNSEGEFVFDHSWARFAEHQLRIDYYPKLIVAIPFTPATGPRVLVRADQDSSEVYAAMSSALRAVTEKVSFSGAHVLFSPPPEARALADTGFAHRYGLQYHWLNAGYESFDDFLARHTAKRRKQIRRERREMSEQGTKLERLTGADLTPEVVDAMFEFYLSTINKYFYGRQYLSREFFEDVCSRMRDRILVVLARDAGSGRPVAGAFNLMGAGGLFGRYWGCREERRFLHFNVCYYEGIEECIQRKIPVFEPGAGGEHKLARGFEPTITHSVHHLRDRRLDGAVRDYLARERDAIDAHRREYEESPILKAL